MFSNFSYAPWCPACRNLEPIWEKFAVESETLNVRVAEVDVTKSTGCVSYLYSKADFLTYQ